MLTIDKVKLFTIHYSTLDCLEKRNLASGYGLSKSEINIIIPVFLGE